MSGINIHVGSPQRISASVRASAPAPAERQVVFAVRSEFPATGSSETLYIATDEGLVYYYAAGTGYVSVSGGEVTKSYVDTQDDKKVDKLQGKGLSTEDYTTAEKTKLGYLAAVRSVGQGLSLNPSTGELTATGGSAVQSDWDQTDTSAGDYIRNKPTIPDVSGKANKAVSAAAGNFAGLDATGDLVDSGKNASDFAAASHTHTKDQISDFPALGTAAGKDVAVSGNASSLQVVMGNDTRLTDARNAADVYDWAKAAAKPVYTASEVGAAESGHSHSAATRSSAGFMSDLDKTKLDGIAAGATANTVLDTFCTLAAASWTGNAVPYTQTVNITGILASDKPILDVSVSDTVATGISETEQWAYITKATAGAGTITFSCYENKPTNNLTVNVKVVR